MNRGRVLALLLALCAAFVPARGNAQGPILEVRLAGVGSVVVQGGGTMEEPRLPAEPVFALVGRDVPPSVEMISVPGLESELGVPVQYDARRALVEILDRFRQLPASRSQLDRARSKGEARPSVLQPSTGVFGSVAAADDGEYLTRLGYSFGRAQVSASTSREGADEWQASVNPAGRWWISYADGSGRGPRFSSRLAVGSTFATVQFRPEQEEVGGRITSSFGPFSVSAQSRDVLEGMDRGSVVATWRGDPVTVSVARTPDNRYLARASFGARTPSPIAIPRVR